jgi:hypothetical protein
MKGNDFLDSISSGSRPEPNVEGDFDCIECRKRVFVAYHDKTAATLTWWCDDDHESSIKAAW